MRTVDRLEFSVSNDVMFTHIHSLKQGKYIFGVVHIQHEITGIKYFCGSNWLFSLFTDDLELICSQSECSLGEAQMSSINSLTESVSMAT